MSTDVGDCWIGFDLGGTKMLAMVLDESFKPIAQRRKKTRGNDGEGEGLKRIVRTIEKLLEESGIARERIRGIGIGCPGPLDITRGIILDAPNLGWENVPVTKTLEKEFGCPAVILNDVDAGVYAESCVGAARSARTVLGIFPGTGIGGGCVYEGKIIQGKSSSCMEIGHIQVDPAGPRCGCGLYGCLEAVASRLAISAAAAQAVFRGQAPHLKKIAGTNLSEIRSGALAESIEKGDRVIEEIVRHAARKIGVAAAGVVHLISPDVIVMGGGLVSSMPRLFVDTVSQSIRDHVMPAFRKSFHVLPAQLGDDATAIGAASWAREVVTTVGSIPTAPKLPANPKRKE